MPKQSRFVGKKVVIIAKPPQSSWARVLFGTLEEYDRAQAVAVLSNARQALYYSEKSGGELGLATLGVLGDSRVSATASLLEVNGVTFVAITSKTAIDAWEKAPIWEGR